MEHTHEVTTDGLPMIVGVTPAQGETPEKIGFQVNGIDTEALNEGTLQLNITYEEADYLIEKLIELAEFELNAPSERLAAAKAYWANLAKRKR
jgi:hypothetical protein